MMTNKQIDDLKLFNEKSAVLLTSTFANAMLKNASGFMFSYKANEGYEAIIVGAEGESVDAAFLTLRMFMQDNDRVSVRNIAKIYSKEQNLADFRADFNSARSQLNKDLETSTGIIFFDKNYTYYEILELLMYGSKSHTNREKEAELRTLIEKPIVSQLFLNQANVAAALLMQGIAAIAEINQRALISLKPECL